MVQINLPNNVNSPIFVPSMYRNTNVASQYSDTSTITINKFPLVIITDSHTNLKNVKVVKDIHPLNDIICLGDITFLFNKSDNFNCMSIRYFKDNKIPCLLGNHEEQLINSSKVVEDVIYAGYNSYGNYSYLGSPFSNISLKSDYQITHADYMYLKSLPIGFKVKLKTGKEVLFYHNKPNDLWTHLDYRAVMTPSSFIKDYKTNPNTQSVVVGHMHKHSIHRFPNFPTKLFVVGRISKDGDYALLHEDGNLESCNIFS